MKIEYTTEKIVEALKKVKSGLHPIDVGKELQINHVAISSWCRKVGLKYARKQRFAFRDWDAIKQALEM